MPADYILELRGISKSFGSNTVLSDIDVSIRPGEIHALLGENGAGKSTLMNILFGMPVIHATGGYGGTIRFEGNEVTIASPNDAMGRGIGMVHQEFMLIPGFTVTENIKLNRELARQSFVSRALGESLEVLDGPAMRRDARKALNDVGMIGLDEYARVSGLPVGFMQFVEIAREIDKTGVKLLVFDEPTAVLTEGEAAQLMGVMRSIAERGIAIVFITHRLDEVMAVADRISVLRDGKLAATKSAGETDLIELASLMIGRVGGEGMVDLPRRAAPLSDTIALDVRGLAVEMPGERVTGATFSVREGEIFGIGGLAGQGKIGIPNGLIGLYEASGDATLFGERIELGDVGGTLRKGVAMLSEDRRGVGLLLGESIEGNIAFNAMQIKGRFLKSLLPRLRGKKLPKLAERAAWALSILLLLAGFYGMNQFQTAFDTSVGIDAYVAYQNAEAARLGGEEPMEEGASASEGDEILPDEPEAEAVGEASTAEEIRFLSDRPAESLTGGERALLFLARAGWTLLADGALLALILIAYRAMSKGSATVLDKRAIREFTKKMIVDLDIRCTGGGQLVGTLSGGNQQKVCVARALALSPRFLFVSEPTRGIDIGAKRLVLETLVRLNREENLTIVMVSSELMELRSICDRIAIVSGGKISRVFESDAPDADIGLAMSGIVREEGAL